MSLSTLHLTLLTDLDGAVKIGQTLALDGARLLAGSWAVLDGQRLVIDLPTQTLIIRRSDGVVLEAIRSAGLTLLGVDETGERAIFSEDLSWNYQVWVLADRRWMDNPDPDFPRFILEEDGQSAWLIDLDTQHRCRLEELPPAELRRSA